MPQTQLAPERHAAHSEHRCGCDCKCGCVPAEFVRMRYYYGQLLGATDLLDEQAYLIGKHRFHNARLHGWGILCGLRAERYVAPQTNPETATTTILKVLRGAAIDHCGNEVIVAGDYCIDVNAWFLSRKPKIESIAPPVPTPAHPAPPISSLHGPLTGSGGATGPGGTSTTTTTATKGKVFVAIRYEECPSEPSFAPRDPCGCDDGGCEFARVRESFKLDLITADQLKDAPRDPPFPWGPNGEHLDALLDPTGAALREVASAPCPIPCRGGWLIVAEVPVTLDDNKTKIINIGTPVNSTPLRRVLLSTSAIQRAIGMSPEALLGGPSFLPPTISDDGKTISLPVRLVLTNSAPVPLEDGTLSDDPFQVRLFDGDWDTSIFKNAVTNADGNGIDLPLKPPFAKADDKVRVSINQDPAAPITDKDGRAIAPLSWARTFIVKSVAGKLTLVDFS